jgi:hypothetical protein
MRCHTSVQDTSVWDYLCNYCATNFRPGLQWFLHEHSAAEDLVKAAAAIARSVRDRWRRSCRWQADRRHCSSTDQSDLDGSFVIRDVVPGTYTIVAVQDAWGFPWLEPGLLARYVLHGQDLIIGEPVGSRSICPIQSRCSHVSWACLYSRKFTVLATTVWQREPSQVLLSGFPSSVELKDLRAIGIHYSQPNALRIRLEDFADFPSSEIPHAS